MMEKLNKMEYQTILEAIKNNQAHFVSTCLARSKTTPSHVNLVNHLEMAEAINTKNWHKVEDLLISDEYKKPLEGVIYCLSRYSGIDHETQHNIVDLLNNNQIV